MCDLPKLQKGYTIPSNFSVDIFEPANVCLKYDSSYIRLKRNPSASLDVKYFENERLPDGIFNFIFTEDNTLIASPLENAFEIASKHKHIALFKRASNILSAGEMVKFGKTLQFNLMSGTFMKDFMLNTLSGLCKNELIQRTIELFQLYYPTYKIEFITSSFITAKYLPLKREHILKYKQAGYEVRLYPTKKACVAEEGVYTTYQDASRRKTRRRKTSKKH